MLNTRISFAWIYVQNISVPVAFMAQCMFICFAKQRKGIWEYEQHRCYEDIFVCDPPKSKQQPDGAKDLCR